MNAGPRHQFYILGFFVALLFYGGVVTIGQHLGMVWIDTVAALFVCICLALIFPEPDAGLGWGKRSVLVLCSFTLALYAVWLFGFWLWESHSSDIRLDVHTVIPLLGFVVATPWFEEKLLRHLLLSSLAGFIRPVLASIAVSALFAVAHKGVMLWAFIVSLALCWMRFRFKAKTAHCVIVHGLINAYVLLLYML